VGEVTEGHVEIQDEFFSHVAVGFLFVILEITCMTASKQSRPTTRWTFTVLRAIGGMLLLVALLAPATLQAQGRFQLQRTKKTGVPINFVLYAGYNGLSDPADLIQDAFENTLHTTISGLMVGMQGLIELDTTLTRLWFGTELFYHRMAKRWTLDKENVTYRGEETRVEAIERMAGYGGHVFLAIGPVRRITLHVGVGGYYLHASVDIRADIDGLFEPRVVPSFLLGANIQLLRYEHGSIDANLRGVQSFGDYGSFHFQSLLGFTFSFQ